jgi:hypothetical protein
MQAPHEVDVRELLVGHEVTLLLSNFTTQPAFRVAQFPTLPPCLRINGSVSPFSDRETLKTHVLESLVREDGGF